MRRIFYDNKKKLCKGIVNNIEKLDYDGKFTITSLEGKKAKLVFSGNHSFLRKSSFVFIEGNKVWTKANAVFRIYWLLNKRGVGWCFVIPGFIMNPFYSLLVRWYR